MYCRLLPSFHNKVFQKKLSCIMVRVLQCKDILEGNEAEEGADDKRLIRVLSDIDILFGYSLLLFMQLHAFLRYTNIQRKS